LGSIEVFDTWHLGGLGYLVVTGCLGSCLAN
jgi:hypothetical protein